MTPACNPSSVFLSQALSEDPFMAHFAQALTANVGHVVRELQAVHALSGLHALPEGQRIFTSLAYLVTRESHPTGRTVHVQQCGCGGGSHHERHPGALRFVVKGQTELVALVPATPPKTGSVAVVLSKLPPGAVVGDVAAFAPLQAEGAEGGEAGGATVLVRSAGEVEVLTLKRADVHSILPQPTLSALTTLAQQRAAWQHRQLATLSHRNASHSGLQGEAEHPNLEGERTPASKAPASPAAASPPLTASPDRGSPCGRPHLGRSPSAPNPFLAAAAIIANRAAHPRAYELAEARALAALKAGAAFSAQRSPTSAWPPPLAAAAEEYPGGGTRAATAAAAAMATTATTAAAAAAAAATAPPNYSCHQPHGLVASTLPPFARACSRPLSASGHRTQVHGSAHFTAATAGLAAPSSSVPACRPVPMDASPCVPAASSAGSPSSPCPPRREEAGLAPPPSCAAPTSCYGALTPPSLTPPVADTPISEALVRTAATRRSLEVSLPSAEGADAEAAPFAPLNSHTAVASPSLNPFGFGQLRVVPAYDFASAAHPPTGTVAAATSTSTAASTSTVAGVAAMNARSPATAARDGAFTAAISRQRAAAIAATPVPALDSPSLRRHGLLAVVPVPPPPGSARPASATPRVPLQPQLQPPPHPLQLPPPPPQTQPQTQTPTQPHRHFASPLRVESG